MVAPSLLRRHLRAKRNQLLPNAPCVRQHGASFPPLYTNPLAEPEYSFDMELTYTAMTFARLEDRKGREAFFPITLKRIPNKTNRIEPFLSLRGHSRSVCTLLFACTLSLNPRAKLERSFNTDWRHPTVTISCLEFGQCCETVLPCIAERVPNKPNLLQSLFSFSGQGISARTLITYPHSNSECLFELTCWHAAMTFACFELG